MSRPGLSVATSSKRMLAVGFGSSGGAMGLATSSTGVSEVAVRGPAHLCRCRSEIGQPSSLSIRDWLTAPVPAAVPPEKSAFCRACWACARGVVVCDADQPHATASAVPQVAGSREPAAQCHLAPGGAPSS